MCGIFTIKDGVNKHKGEPNYDLFLLALKSTAKRLYPNYCNDEWSVQKGAVKSDREMRKSVIDSLTNEEKEKLKKNLTDESCKYMDGSFVIDFGACAFYGTSRCVDSNGNRIVLPWNDIHLTVKD